MNNCTDLQGRKTFWEGEKQIFQRSRILASAIYFSDLVYTFQSNTFQSQVEKSILYALPNVLTTPHGKLPGEFFAIAILLIRL